MRRIMLVVVILVVYLVTVSSLSYASDRGLLSKFFEWIGLKAKVSDDVFTGESINFDLSSGNDVVPLGLDPFPPPPWPPDTLNPE